MRNGSYYKPGSPKKRGANIKVAALSFILLFICMPHGMGFIWEDVIFKQRKALIALYKSTNGDYWSDNSGWKTPPLYRDGFAFPGTEKNWKGITCHRLRNSIKGIDLSDNNLTGTLPTQLGDLPQLEYLNLSSNQITGSIPPELGSLTSLKILDLRSNLLTGEIPVELTNLANLFDLLLSSNGLTGIIPPELVFMTTLNNLDLSSNRLTGPIPPGIGYIPELHTLSLSGNQLEGHIPAELGFLTELDKLDLSSNRLTGPIPPALGNLPDLNTILDLHSNCLTGVIPPELGNLVELYRLDLSSNQLEGNIPRQLENLPVLADNESDFRWNKLYTNDDSTRFFINSKQRGGKWESFQTVTPQEIAAHAVSGTSIEVSWAPIPYSHDEGGYMLFYSRTPGGPYTFFAATETKFDSRLIFTGVEPFTPYYFMVQTLTRPHLFNPNHLESGQSIEVSAFTRGSDKIVSGRVVTPSGEGVPGVTMTISPPDATVITDGGGYFRFPVETGWTGIVGPSETRYNYDRLEERIDAGISAHKVIVDFIAVPITRSISGYVLSVGEGIEGVTLYFTSIDGDIQTAVTDPEGFYECLVSHEWMGGVTPFKDQLSFYPGTIDYLEPVTKHLFQQNYQLSVSVTLQASREKDRSVIIRNDYGRIILNAVTIGIDDESVQTFVIYRKELNGVYKRLTEFPRQAPPYRYTYIDRYLDKNKTYVYKGEALDAAGNTIGESREKSI